MRRLVDIGSKRQLFTTQTDISLCINDICRQLLRHQELRNQFHTFNTISIFMFLCFSVQNTHTNTST
ncbi:hypothetical protein Hanom_Chr14g01292831 [Helianthus anomalus]